ncbi:Raf-like protein serine/threonine-protein kinase [Diplonema papillatum]|nr:Raf-like protein serine/threonine-protein kinase [Diplonema papillatum]
MVEEKKKPRRRTAGDVDGRVLRKPPLPHAALSASMMGGKVPPVPISRPTPGAAAKKKPKSPRVVSPSPIKTTQFSRSMTDSRGSQSKPGVPPPLKQPLKRDERTESGAPRSPFVKAERPKFKKPKKQSSLRNAEMCPKCGTIVPKGIIKHGGEHSIGSFSIDPRDLVVNTSKVLGEGGFGVVYLGDFQATEVAVKVMLTKKRPTQSDIDDWKKEVDIMTHLRHPNILAILGAVFDEARLAIVTEYCAKGSLRKVVKDIARGARLEVTWSRKLDWLQQIAKGMAFLHHKRIHHRDLKASNIFVSGDTMKIADFGLSNFRSGPSTPTHHPATPERRESGHVSTPLDPLNNSASLNDTIESSPGKDDNAKPDASGTFAFVAPEVWKNRPFTNASDVYSFGVLMIELLTTKIPFDDVPEEEEEKCARRIRRGTARPAMPDSLGGDAIPDSIRDVIHGCLQFASKNRPSFRELVDSLQQEMEEAYAFCTCPVPYESDDEGEDPAVEEFDPGHSDSCDDDEDDDAEGWSRGEY